MNNRKEIFMEKLKIDGFPYFYGKEFLFYGVKFGPPDLTYFFKLDNYVYEVTQEIIELRYRNMEEETRVGDISLVFDSKEEFDETPLAKVKACKAHSDDEKRVGICFVDLFTKHEWLFIGEVEGFLNKRFRFDYKHSNESMENFRERYALAQTTETLFID